MSVLTMNGTDVFESNTIVLAPGAAASTSGRVFFGRPWGGNVQLSLNSDRILPLILPFLFKSLCQVRPGSTISIETFSLIKCR